MQIDQLKKISLVLAIVCVVALLFLSELLSAKFISSPKEIESLKVNQKVSVTGLVIKEEGSLSQKILILSNGFHIYCDDFRSDYISSNLTIEGKIIEINNKRYLQAIKIVKNIKL